MSNRAYFERKLEAISTWHISLIIMYCFHWFL